MSRGGTVEKIFGDPTGLKSTNGVQQSLKLEPALMSTHQGNEKVSYRRMQEIEDVDGIREAKELGI